MCSDCGCCSADFICGDGTPLCWPCDAGEHKAMVAVAQPQPAAVKAAEPEPIAPLETPMEKRKCACGCGTDMSENNNWLFARGHKPGGRRKKKTSPKSALARIEPQIVIEEETEFAVSLDLTGAQLDRIWTSLPIEEKALAISVALTAERS